jgi:hypothetical protein
MKAEVTVIRRWLAFFIAALIVSGATAFALETEMRWLVAVWPSRGRRYSVLRLSSRAEARYSERRLVTGLARAAFIALAPTVINAITIEAATATAKTSQPMAM